jgi:hypothetical protein
MVGNDVLACHQTKTGTDCFANDIKTHIKVIYKCKRVSKEKGYIKECKTQPTI